MPHLSDVSIDMNAVANVLDDGGLDALLHIAGGAVANEARQRANKKTGDGAASIRHRIVRGDRGLPEAHVSWDSDHYYMRFLELGTSRQAAQPFLRPALTAARI